MFFGRRRALLRRAVAFAAAVAVQLWSVAPVAAPVIYCIGEDGHSGFEMVRVGARGCAACCHEAREGEARDAHLEQPVSECTDIAMAPAEGATAKAADVAAPAPLLAALSPPVEAAPARWDFARTDPPPPRGSPTRLRRQTVLLI